MLRNFRLFSPGPMVLKIHPQPDDFTCGPTSLHAVYHYLGFDYDLESLIDEINYLEEGGTLAVMLAIDALSRGFKATIITYNLSVFDPSWQKLSSLQLVKKLEKQAKLKNDPKLIEATHSYIEFLNLGGRIIFKDLTDDLLSKYLKQNMPILTGLNSSYLYGSTRELVEDSGNVIFDDLRGSASGHFVVIAGLRGNQAYIADPYKENPSQKHYYKVPVSRLINSILLGILTYDANLLIIEK